MRILVLDDNSSEIASFEAIRAQDLTFAMSDRMPERHYAFAGFVLDPLTRVVLDPSGQVVDLTSSEFDLLMAFVAQPGAPLSRSALLNSLKGRTWNYFDRSIDTLVSRLRKKIDAERSGRRLIRSVRAVGYVFCAGVELRSAMFQNSG